MANNDGCMSLIEALNNGHIEMVKFYLMHYVLFEAFISASASTKHFAVSVCPLLSAVKSKAGSSSSHFKQW